VPDSTTISRNNEFSNRMLENHQTRLPLTPFSRKQAMGDPSDVRLSWFDSVLDHGSHHTNALGLRLTLQKLT